jgi:ABC-2 type transport system permease protein
MRAAWAYARSEFRTTITRGEGLLVSFLIPIGVLIGFSKIRTGGLEPRPLSFLLPGTITMAVIASAFVSLAIATAFERRYGVLKRLGTTPLGREGVVFGKIFGIAMVIATQVVVQVLIAKWMGWNFSGNLFSTFVVLLVGCVLFGGLGLWMAGTLRAEGTLAFSNLGFMLMSALGGFTHPIVDLPTSVQPIADFLPAAPFARCLRTAMDGGSFHGGDIAVVAIWILVGTGAAIRTFRWEE